VAKDGGTGRESARGRSAVKAMRGFSFRRRMAHDCGMFDLSGFRMPSIQIQFKLQVFYECGLMVNSY
jgi:hypothetical protein